MVPGGHLCDFSDGKPLIKSADMKKLLLVLGAVLWTLLCWNCQPTALYTADSRPNVILIMTDDQGYGDLSCHGNPYLKTPNLDKLHAQSIRLTNFHVGTTCSPTRAGLMTGRNCNRVGVWHTIEGRSQLAAGEMTMAEVFAHNGYATSMFGKWHLGDSHPFEVQNRGFQTVFAHGGGGVGQMSDFWDNDYFDDTYFRNGKPEKATGYCSDVWFDAALDFIDSNREAPFFVYLATNAPHGPFHVDSSYLRPYLENEQVASPNFNGMIANLDENMEVLLRKLDEWQLTDNTILIFLTDNGTAAGVRFDQEGKVLKGYNADMRGIKGSEYEGGHRVPCFLRLPGKEADAGTDISLLTAHVDLLPTLMDLLQLQAPREVTFDGRSIAPLLAGNTEDAIWKSRVLITDTQRQEHPEKWRKSATMMDKWRLINGKELYDIEQDPGQQNDVAQQHPERVIQLRKAYESWWKELEPGFANVTRAVLGAEVGKPNTLYAHDMHEVTDAEGKPAQAAWHQNHIREGKEVNGHWAVEVAESGTYRFELRRWPAELDQPIRGSIPGRATVPGGNPFVEGKSLPLTKARIAVGGQEMSENIAADAHQVSFELQLTAGPAQVKTWLEGKNDLQLGAYYVYVSRIE